MLRLRRRPAAVVSRQRPSPAIRHVLPFQSVDSRVGWRSFSTDAKVGCNQSVSVTCIVCVCVLCVVADARHLWRDRQNFGMLCLLVERWMETLYFLFGYMYVEM